MTEIDTMKCVIVLDAGLKKGLLANAAAVLAANLGHGAPWLMGHDLEDGSGSTHPGITRLPIPILKNDGPGLRDLRERASQAGVLMADFCDVAQRCTDYTDYECKLAMTESDDLNYVGLALMGEAGAVNSLTGSLGLLR